MNEREPEAERSKSSEQAPPGAETAASSTSGTTTFSGQGAIPPVAMAAAMTKVAHKKSASDQAFGETKPDAKPDPLMMPPEIVAYEKQYNMGQQHLEWHIERQWDSFVKDPANAKFAQQHGWKKAPIQEGEKGNGLQFLAMHRSMLETLRATFPQDAALFDGWDTPPLKGDAENPGPSTPMDPRALKAIDTLEHLDQHINEFADDDDFGRFVETALGPAHPPDLGMAGVHNYLHNRLSDDKSPINMGDPTVNIENKMFWRLHGWIDKRWDAFRQLKKEQPSQPEYVEAMKDAMNGMHMGPMPGDSPMQMGTGADTTEEVPASVRNFMTHGGSWSESGK